MPRQLTDSEIEELPRVKALKEEIEDLKAEINEYEEGISLVVGRIDDEGYTEIADQIAKEETVKGVFEKISEFFSDCLKGNLKKVANIFSNSFKM